jgi:hypothetical protein
MLSNQLISCGNLLWTNMKFVGHQGKGWQLPSWPLNKLILSTLTSSKSTIARLICFCEFSPPPPLLHASTCFRSSVHCLSNISAWCKAWKRWFYNHVMFSYQFHNTTVMQSKSQTQKKKKSIYSHLLCLVSRHGDDSSHSLSNGFLCHNHKVTKMGAPQKMPARRHSTWTHISYKSTQIDSFFIWSKKCQCAVARDEEKLCKRPVINLTGYVAEPSARLRMFMSSEDACSVNSWRQNHDRKDQMCGLFFWDKVIFIWFHRNLRMLEQSALT